MNNLNFNHDISIYGASHYLYILFTILKKKFKNIRFIICEIKYNPQVIDKYNISNNIDLSSKFADKMYSNMKPVMNKFNQHHKFQIKFSKILSL